MKLDKKKITVLVLGVLTLLVLIGSASYAYYSISVTNNKTNTNVKGNTTAIDNIALKNTTNNMHIILNTKDMSLDNKRDYYAVTEEGKNYEVYEHGIDLAELKATGGDKRTAYDCEVKVTVTKKDDDTMISTLEEGETELYITYGNLATTYDLFNLKTDSNKEFNGHITLINNSSDFIHSYLKVINNEKDQTHLAGKKLDIDIDTEVTKCDVIGTSKIELALRNTNTSNTLSKELKGGMFRYQGTADQVTDNYICFGTDDQQNCLNYQDQYMYRIIGVTPEGRLKLIKKEALEDTYQWNDGISGEPEYDKNVPWPQNNIYGKINDTDFLNNEKYLSDKWRNKIYDNLWIYGSFQYGQNGIDVYLIETGKKDTIRYNLDPLGETISLAGDSRSKYYLQNVYYHMMNEKLFKTIRSKISLMYTADYYLSTNDEVLCNGEGNYELCKTSWMFLSNNDPTVPSEHEWTMSYNGMDRSGAWYLAYGIAGNGAANATYPASVRSIRPVFFLNNDIEISGKGTKDEPYMIKLENK